MRLPWMDAVRAHERELTAYALERLSALPGVRIFGPTDPDLRGGVVTFTVDGITPQNLALALDQRGIAIRSGRHCAHPLHRRLGLAASARASFTIYNDLSDIDALADGIAAIQRNPPLSDVTSADCAGDASVQIDCADAGALPNVQGHAIGHPLPQDRQVRLVCP
jgi:hypothetical protein